MWSQFYLELEKRKFEVEHNDRKILKKVLWSPFNLALEKRCTQIKNS